MDKQEALEIISMVIDGIDPYDEEDPSKNPPETNPVTVRALCAAVASLMRLQDREEFAGGYQTKKLKDLTEYVNGPLKAYLEEKEKETIRDALIEAKYIEDDAATILDVTPSELRQKILKYKLDAFILIKDYFDSNSGTSLDQFLETIESQIIAEALIKAAGNKHEAAKLIGITFRSLRYRVEKPKIKDKSIVLGSNYIEHFKIKLLDTFLKEVEKEAILEALKRTGFNKTEAADLLGITFRSLRYRLEQLGID
jgi:DNA-binding NtrC family response regulator